MIDDAELLHRYVADRSEAAFTELVERHLGLVYHAALRQCSGDTHRAKDIAQMVFSDLARKASTLTNHTMLAGWLYTGTHYAATQVVRAEIRRQTRESSAQAMSELQTGDSAPTDWTQIRPIIDETLLALGKSDREAVLLRFFEGRTFAEIGTHLAMNEDAARMRVRRALEKMREIFVRHGVTSTWAAIGSALATQAEATVPVGLAATITKTALAGGISTAIATTFMSMTKLKIGTAVAVLALGTTGLVVQQRINSRLRTDASRLSASGEENARLRNENQRLLEATARTADLSPDHAKLAQSRSELNTKPAAVSELTGHSITTSGKRSNGDFPLAAGLSPVESLGNAGRATPRATFATQLWAARTGNAALEATAITFGPEARAKLVTLTATLPDELRAQYDTPEKLMAFILSGSRHPVAGMQVLGETTQGPDDVILQTQWQHADDSIVHQSEVQFHREAEEWKMVVPVALVDRAATYFSRKTVASPVAPVGKK